MNRKCWQCCCNFAWSVWRCSSKDVLVSSGCLDIKHSRTLANSYQDLYRDLDVVHLKVKWGHFCEYYRVSLRF